MEVLMRDNRVIESFLKKTQRKLKEMSLFKSLKKEVETGANGTQNYIIKKGINKDTIAKK
jgi:hypothetical protein|tara:strand:+ start:208 stop:387 length:180 start_codon:yes stop_codon:yes gene_type:complete